MQNSDVLIRKRYSAAVNVSYCLKNTARYYPMLLMWCALSIIVQIALPILTTFLPKTVIDAITIGGNVWNIVGITLLFTVTIALFMGVKRFVGQYVYWHRFKMNACYTRMVANKGLTTDYPNQEDERFRRLQTESQNACDGNYSPVVQVYDVLISLSSAVAGFGIYFALLARLNVLVALFLIAGTAVSYLLNAYIIKWTEKNSDEKIRYTQRTGYISNVSGDPRSAKDIRMYGMGKWLNKIYSININALSDWYRRYSAKVFGVSLADSALSLANEGVAYVYLIALVLASKITVADFVLYFGVVTGFSVWLSDILGQLNTLSRINISINHMRNYLEYPDSYSRTGGKSTRDILEMPRRIELKDVSYRYQGAEDYALRHVNLTLDPSEQLAIVGLNGAGKTTLVKLICGLTQPTEGEVLYDGINIGEYDRKEFYRLFSAVFQQYSLLPVSVSSLVSCAAAESTDFDRVKQCLMTAGLWEKVQSLPNGMDTPFGKTIYDEGIDFSGGEVQKLLLARALYKNAPVMILDEPTAALDPISENKLYEIYADTMRGKTVLFISHRLASTRFCDRIVLIENGSIIEQGTHDSLLGAKGRYYELFETQAKYYREHPDGEEAAQ